MFNFLKKHGSTPKFPEFPSLNTVESPKFPSSEQKPDFPQFKEPINFPEPRESQGFPKFPEPKGTFLDNIEEKHEEIPTYKPAFPSFQSQEIKTPLTINFPTERPRIEPKDELEIPIRKPIFKSTIAQESPRIEEKLSREKLPSNPIYSKEDSIFVKVEKYEDARNLISAINEKLEETEKLISEMDKSKEEEELQLKSYLEAVNSIKQKLLEIERTLFTE